MKSANTPALHRGLVIMAGGVAMMVFLMVGGGFLTATNARYWCGVLWSSFAFGLICPGLPLYLWARKNETFPTSKPCTNVGFRPKFWFYLAFGVLQVATAAVYRTYFGSEFSKTNLGMHLFPVLMGVCFGSLAMIGLGVALSATTKPLIDDRLL